MTTQDLTQRILTIMKREGYKPLKVQQFEDELGMIEAAEFKELVKTLVRMEAMGDRKSTRLNSSH